MTKELRNLMVQADIGLGLEKMYFVQNGAEVTEGEYTGTGVHISITGASPIVYVKKNGKHLGSVAFTLQSILSAAIDIIEKETTP